MLSGLMGAIRAQMPLVHCITNYVTANDCANLLLACGASPIMADDPDECREVTRMCRALVLNLGTPSPRRTEAMLRSGREAVQMGLPVVFDPVGVGCSHMRMDAAARILSEAKPSIIRGNASEISALCELAHPEHGADYDDANASLAALAHANHGSSHDDAPTSLAALAHANHGSGNDDATAPLAALTHAGHGVDADQRDAVHGANRALALARRTGAVVLMTGASDIVTDGRTLLRVNNGDSMMRLVTGAGCQLSALAGVFAAVSPNEPLAAALAAACAMGLCGEMARRALRPDEGSASFRMRMIDAMSMLTPDMLKEGANYDTDKADNAPVCGD